MTKQASYRHLSGIQEYKLMRLLENQYAEKKLSDEDFAKYAAEELKCNINRDHVYKRRRELEIPATRTLSFTKKNDNEAVLDMICSLEARIVALEKLLASKMVGK